MTTMPVADDMPLDPDDELLVAYLDGELERADRTRLENRLLDESGLRSRLQQLQSGWDMLEELPDPAPSVKLVETTLELAVADLVAASPDRTSWFSRWRYPIGILGSCLATAVLAMGATALAKKYAFRNELQSLAIAENLDAYNQAVDLNLMRQLSRDDQWTRMLNATEKVDGVNEGEVKIADVAIDQREAAIESMSVPQRTQLYSRWERYKRLEGPDRDRIQEFAGVVSQQTDRETLLKTMKAYAVWRESLPAEMVDRIESSSGDAQKKAIADAIDRTMVSISERSSGKLSDDAIESIYFALRKILDQRLERMTPEIQTRIAELKDRFGSGQDASWGLLNLMFGHRDSRRRSPPSMAGGAFGERQDPLRQDELGVIRLMLSPSDLESLIASSGGGDPLLEAMTLKTWAEEAIRRKAPWPRRGDETMLSRYLDMPADDREAIELLPAEEMLRELSPPSRR
ncbi:hypothetical protein Poly51_04870 [Rubripirellula tenax]|uniref:Zinc-finger domain-containing protein n=1 Tax=Rubripirellula tenax TaxID=2528015 RepID=A0A5C6FKR9_9BACT|nr:hypothetical protein [Rubripirellula tenax]TWU60212.1 hypothetical protein Poly51_04870 [Rubripirellula tenax]